VSVCKRRGREEGEKRTRGFVSDNKNRFFFLLVKQSKNGNRGSDQISEKWKAGRVSCTEKTAGSMDN
jgi:hypothetical protein